MPLSRARDRARKHQSRLDAKLKHPVVQPNIPLYNPTSHKIGDTVRVQRGRRDVMVTIPELDADGQPIPEST